MPTHEMLSSRRLLSRLKEASDETFDPSQRWSLLALAVGAYVISSLIAGGIGVFAEPGFNASLLADLSPIGAIMKTALITVAVGIAATFAGKSVRPDAGLFASAIALLAIRRTAGLGRSAYLASPTGRTLLLLAVETVALAVTLGVVYAVARRAVAKGIIPDDATFDGTQPDPEPLSQKILATATLALVLAVGLLFLCRTDAQMQVTMTLFICALVAAWCTVRFIPATPSFYFWFGPIAAGALGYVLTSFGPGPNLNIGEPGGYFGPLAKAMPLDYASAGVAGALYGYWIGRKHLPRDEVAP